MVNEAQGYVILVVAGAAIALSLMAVVAIIILDVRMNAMKRTFNANTSGLNERFGWVIEANKSIIAAIRAAMDETATLHNDHEGRIDTLFKRVNDLGGKVTRLETVEEIASDLMFEDLLRASVKDAEAKKAASTNSPVSVAGEVAGPGQAVAVAANSKRRK